MKTVFHLFLFLFVYTATCFTSSWAEQRKRLVPTEILTSDFIPDQIVEGGNGASIGGDVVDRRRLTAWFYGNKKIETCFTYSESFGAPKARVKKALETAFRRWKNYIEKKKISNKDTNKKVNASFHLRERCRGEEDLRLHFATGPIYENMRDLKATQSLDNPVAFANKTHIAEGMAWSKGYIRFVGQGYYSNSKTIFPNWKKSGSVETVVLHELGHVLGFDHTPGTVMDAGIVSQVFLKKEQLTPSIDGDVELVVCSVCDERYDARVFTKDGKSLMKHLGFQKGEKIQLLRKGKRLFLVEEGVKREVKVVDSQVVKEQRTHLSNFSGVTNGSFFNRSFIGEIKSSKGENHSVLISPSTRNGKGVLSLRVGRDHRLLEVAHFSKTKEL